MEQYKYYTDEVNTQILLALLKAHNIRRVIVSPGATNTALVGSMQHDNFFEMYSCVDERSAAYMACGMAEESGEPVILSCTGATSSRNYMPGLTEAFYRKLPILAVTSSMASNRLGHLYAQFTDRSTPPSDCVKKSYLLQIVKDQEDYWDCTVKTNDAILELTHGVSGPVHINLERSFSNVFPVKELPKVTVIKRFETIAANDEIPQGRIGVFIGQHKKMSVEESATIDDFCEKYDAVLLADKTSGYHGKCTSASALLATQEGLEQDFSVFDLIIHIGEISGDYYTIGNIRPKEVWRVAPDGIIRDRFKKLTRVYQMDEITFFRSFSEKKSKKSSINITNWEKRYQFVKQNIPGIPFSTIWIANFLANEIPAGSILYLSILNVLRAWNFFETDKSIDTISNVGGFGIDGMTSSLIGASLVNPQRLCFGITGDLNFFYDLNALGNRHVGSNVRILLINNGHGQEFRTYKHAANLLGNETEPYISAAGHFGNKSAVLVKSVAESLGYKYLTASNKEDFMNVYSEFVTSEQINSPIIFEVFTENDHEHDSLKLIRNILPKSVESKIKDTAKSILGSNGIKFVKKIVGK